MAPACFGDVVVVTKGVEDEVVVCVADALFAQLEETTKTHTRVRRALVRSVCIKTVFSSVYESKAT